LNNRLRRDEPHSSIDLTQDIREVRIALCPNAYASPGVLGQLTPPRVLQELWRSLREHLVLMLRCSLDDIDDLIPEILRDGLPKEVGHRINESEARPL